MMATMDFWYKFANTYSYPAVMRVEDLAAKASVAVRWRPFLLGPIFTMAGTIPQLLSAKGPA
jgi:2-hydroxychromene-2-carboxylate isomerase